jgi:hypothetical protein
MSHTNFTDAEVRKRGDVYETHYPHFIDKNWFEFASNYNGARENLKANLRRRFEAKFGQKAFVKYMSEKNVGNAVTQKQMENFNNENRNAKRAAKSKTPGPARRGLKPVLVKNKDVIKHRYLITALLGNNASYLTPNQQELKVKKLLENARKIRLSTAHQLQAWSGSFLETTGFTQGALRKGTLVVDRGTKDTNPLLLIQDEKGRPRTQPTVFIKTAFSIDWLKGANWGRARAVYSPDIVEQMKKLIAFTETLKVASENGNENVTVKGKTKGTTEIQPDIILTLPNGTGGGDIHVYELKIGRGKKETIPAEAIQLAKTKFILDSYLKKLGWVTHVHFLPWMYAQAPENEPNFAPWQYSKIKLVKNVAEKFITQLNQGYNIKAINRKNRVLTNHLNVTTINALMNASRAGRLTNMGRAATKISSQSQVAVIDRLYKQGGNNIEPVVNYLISVKNVVNNENAKAKGFRSIAGIWRDILKALKEAKIAYIARTPRNNLPPSFRRNAAPATMANVSGLSNVIKNKNSNRAFLELKKVVDVAYIFLDSFKAFKRLTGYTLNVSNASLQTVKNAKNAIESIEEVNSGRGRPSIENNVNKMLNQVFAPGGNEPRKLGVLYKRFLEQHAIPPERQGNLKQLVKNKLNTRVPPGASAFLKSIINRS